MIRQQTYAIWWKNLKLRRRHWIMTSFEVTIPIICFIFVVLIRSKIDIFTKVYVNETYHDTVDGELIYSTLNIHGMKLYYAPKTDFTTNLIRKVQLKLNIYNEGIKGFSNEEELISYYDKHGDEKINTVVLFQDVDNYVPTKLKYDVKMYEQQVLWKTDTLFQDFLPYTTESGSENYLQKGFLSIQLALDISFIELASKKDFDILMAFQEFPYPPHLQNNGANTLFRNVLPILTAFSFIALCVSTLQRVMSEKSSGMNALMKMHGLRSSTLWMGWLLNGLALYIIPVIGVVLLLKCSWGSKYATIEYCNVFILFLFLLLYCAASISSLLVITTTFYKPLISMIVGVVFWIVSSVVFCGIAYNIDVMSVPIKLGLLLVPTSSLFYGYSAIANFEQRERELNLSNLFESPTGSSNDVTMGIVLVMLVVDTIIYFIITLYVDHLHPGPRGMSKTWTFRFGTKLKRNIKADEETDLITDQTIVEASGLKMTYGGKETVDIDTLKIGRGKITALLGPNGAGKTTTMAILAGLLKPSSGTVLVNKLELNEENLEKIHKLVRICPQEIILFADLTVADQLTFFGMLRGLSIADSPQHVRDILSEKLKLQDKLNCYPEKLSGGMKKAVSLGISLIGDPKLLILDEPTAGIDIEGRAATWELIHSFTKSSTTILVSTHLTEEADKHADTVIILENGKIVCEGQPSILKKNKGIGHQLIVQEISLEQVKRIETVLGNLVDSNQPTEYSAKYRLARKSSLEDLFEHLKQENISVTAYHPAPDQTIIEIKENLHDETPIVSHESNKNYSVCSFEIKYNSLEAIENVESSLINYTNDDCIKTYNIKYPLRNEHKSKFAKIFKVLEDENVTFNLANPTLEDLYLKVIGEKDGQEEDNTEDKIIPKEHKTNSRCSPKRVAIILVKKRLLYFYKKWTTYISMVLVMLFLTMLVINLCGDEIINVNKDGRKLELVLNTYGETGVFYALHGANNSLLTSKYSDVIKSQDGVPRKVENIQQAIIQESKDNIAYYHQRIITGAEFHSIDDQVIKNVTVMYSHNALHGVSISLNVVTNTLAKYMLGEEYSIAASNTPLHSVQNNVERVGQSSTSKLIIWLTLFPLGPLLILSNAILLVHTETSTLVKHLQHMAGVRPYIYWIVNYLCDCIYCSVSILICSLLFNTTEIYNLGPLIVILMLYVATAIPFSYLFTKNGQLESAYATFILSNVSIGSLLTFISVAMENLGDDSFRSASDIARYFYAINPQFTLNYMLAKYSNKMVENHNWNIKTPDEKANMCNYDRAANPCCAGETSCAEFQSFFNDTSFIYIWIVTIATAVAFMIYLCYRDSIGGIFHKNKDSTMDPAYAMAVNKIRKGYDKLVIKDLSFSVNKGHCLAVLGPNGAGKSTAFRLFAKRENYSSGTIQTDPLPKEQYQKRGYCPQQHALMGEFTARELLNIFAELRGIHKDNVTNLLKKFDLLEYADKPCEHYSGGNKRKLNVCISMIANPQIIILDEPTTGVDLISRQKIWNAIEELKAGNSSIILSSHSMDECAAVCDVALILKDGGKADIGTLDELQRKYSNGFVIKLMLSNTNQVSSESIEESIISDFEEPIIINSTNDFIHFYVKDTSWVKLLEKLETLKEIHKLEDYDLNKSTLQDVFLKVIEKQPTHTRFIVS